MQKEIETKLARARTKLIMDKPFLGALVLRLPMLAAEPKWCPTTATDARHFYYNVDYIGVLSVDQVQFVLAHEALCFIAFCSPSRSSEISKGFGL